MPLSPFTISMQSGVILSNSTSRNTLTSFLMNVGSLKEKSSGILGLATAQSGVEIPFGPVTTCKFLWLKTDMPITVKINGATAGPVVGATDGGREGSMAIFGDSMTSVAVDNASGNEASIEYIICGV